MPRRPSSLLRTTAASSDMNGATGPGPMRLDPRTSVKTLLAPVADMDSASSLSDPSGYVVAGETATATSTPSLTSLLTASRRAPGDGAPGSRAFETAPSIQVTFTRKTTLRCT